MVASNLSPPAQANAKFATLTIVATVQTIEQNTVAHHIGRTAQANVKPEKPVPKLTAPVTFLLFRPIPPHTKHVLRDVATTIRATK